MILRICLILVFLMSGKIGFSFTEKKTKDKTDSLSTSEKLILRIITVEGNKKTKRGIITRELLFTEGDTIKSSELDSVMLRSKRNILNTSLFLSADLDTMVLKNSLEIKITVQERWYTWPNLYFEPADRNINVWWETRDITRVTYGMFLVQENFRGRNERFYLLLKLQYTQQFGIGYTVPFLNKKKKSGFSFSASRSRWHEAAYSTVNNKLKFFRDHNTFMRKEWAAGVSYTYRPKIYNSHSLSAEYKFNEVNDTIARLNSDYFLNGQTGERYIRLGYKFKRDKRDITAYPLHGYYFDFEVVPTFIGFDSKPRNLIWCISTFKQFFELFPRTYFAYSVKGKLSGTARQPYFNERGLGYGNDFVRSYEYYVVDGQHYALFRSNLKYNLLKTKTIKLKKIPLNKFNTIPVALYVNLFYDMGYVWDNQDYKANPLNNSLLYGTGIGLDYVTYYSIVVRGEYSINRMKEKGFFMHVSLPI